MQDKQELAKEIADEIESGHAKLSALVVLDRLKKGELNIYDLLRDMSFAEMQEAVRNEA